MEFRCLVVTVTKRRRGAALQAGVLARDYLNRQVTSAAKLFRRNLGRGYYAKVVAGSAVGTSRHANRPAARDHHSSNAWNHH